MSSSVCSVSSESCAASPPSSSSAVWLRGGGSSGSGSVLAVLLCSLCGQWVVGWAYKASQSGGAYPFNPSSALCAAELVKLLVCVALLLCSHCRSQCEQAQYVAVSTSYNGTEAEPDDDEREQQAGTVHTEARATAGTAAAAVDEQQQQQEEDDEEAEDGTEADANGAMTSGRSARAAAGHGAGNGHAHAHATSGGDGARTGHVEVRVESASRSNVTGARPLSSSLPLPRTGSSGVAQSPSYPYSFDASTGPKASTNSASFSDVSLPSARSKLPSSVVTAMSVSVLVVHQLSLAVLQCLDSQLTFELFRVVDSATVTLFNSWSTTMTALLLWSLFDRPMNGLQLSAIALQVLGLVAVQFASSSARADVLLLARACTSAVCSLRYAQLSALSRPGSRHLHDALLHTFGFFLNFGLYYYLRLDHRRLATPDFFEGYDSVALVVIGCNSIPYLVTHAVNQRSNARIQIVATAAATALLLLFGPALTADTPTATMRQYLGLAAVLVASYAYSHDAAVEVVTNAVKQQQQQQQLEQQQQRQRREERGGWGDSQPSGVRSRSVTLSLLVVAAVLVLVLATLLVLAPPAVGPSVPFAAAGPATYFHEHRIVLILQFNNPRFERLPALRAAYGPIFPLILVMSPETDARVDVVCADATKGEQAYTCLGDVMARWPGWGGYLMQHFDVAINYITVERFDPADMWQVLPNWTGPRQQTDDWSWWQLSQGLDPLWPLMNGSQHRQQWGRYVDNYIRNMGGLDQWRHGSHDAFYIPQRFVRDWQTVAGSDGPVRKTGMHGEIAFPTLAALIAPNISADVEWLMGCWAKPPTVARAFWRHPEWDFFHPLSLNKAAGQAIVEAASSRYVTRNRGTDKPSPAPADWNFTMNVMEDDRCKFA